MRIAIVTPVFPPYRGGIGTVAAEEARQLAELGASITVFTPDYHHGKQHDDGVVRLRPWFRWGNGAICPGVLWRLRTFDAIHLHFPFYGTDILAALAACVWRKPLTITFHMRAAATGWLGALFAFYRVVLEPFVLRAARTVIVSTDDYAREHRVHSRNLVVVPFGVDTERFSPGDDHGFRREHGLVDNVPTILFVGGMDAAHYFKGVDVLLRAASTITTPWQMVLVGSGDMRSAYEELARQLDIASRVHFVGSVPFEQLPDAYRAADVHVLPSINRGEAFGLVTLEAKASGVPSIVSDLPGVRTLVTPGVDGDVFPAGDVAALARELTSYLVEPSRARRCGAAARSRVLAEFDARQLAKRIYALLTLAKR